MSGLDFLCIGAQKAGTTWLEDKLRQNDSIWMPPKKELHFFNKVGSKEGSEWSAKEYRKKIKSHLRLRIENDASYDELKYLVSTIPVGKINFEWYQKIFEAWGGERKKIKGEITPAYLTMKKVEVSSVAEAYPDLKIICFIRHPVDRALSQLKMKFKREGINPVNFSRDDVLSKTEILNRSSYRAGVEVWEEFFGKESILYIPFKRISEAPSSVLKEVEEHIGCEAVRYDGLTEKAHVGKSYEVSDEIVEFLKINLDGECQYLRERFGKDFFEMC